MGAERTSSSGASHDNANLVPPRDADALATRSLAGRADARPPAAVIDAPRASGGAAPFHTPDGRNSSLDSAAQEGPQWVASQAQQTRHTSHGNASYGSGPWCLQPPEAGLSREVAVLQQEVLMLRQQVRSNAFDVALCLSLHALSRFLNACSGGWDLLAVRWNNHAPGCSAPRGCAFICTCGEYVVLGY